MHLQNLCACLVFVVVLHGCEEDAEHASRMAFAKSEFSIDVEGQMCELEKVPNITSMKTKTICHSLDAAKFMFAWSSCTHFQINGSSCECWLGYACKLVPSQEHIIFKKKDQGSVLDPLNSDEATPVPAEATPVPAEATPVPTESTPSPTEATPSPTEATPSPTQAQTTDVPAAMGSATFFEHTMKAVEQEGAKLVSIGGRVFQFNIKDFGEEGKFTLDVKNGNGSAKYGEDLNADLTLTLADSDMVDLIQKRTTAMNLYMAGKLRLEGNDRRNDGQILKAVMLEIGNFSS